MADPQTKKTWAGEAHHFDVDEKKTLFFISLVSLHLLSHNSFDFSTKFKWNTNTNTFILVGSPPRRICFHMFLSFQITQWS